MAKRNTHEQQIRQPRFKRPVGRVEPFDTFENTRDHERLWWELGRIRRETEEDVPEGRVRIADIETLRTIYDPIVWYRFASQSLIGRDDSGYGRNAGLVTGVLGNPAARSLPNHPFGGPSAFVERAREEDYLQTAIWIPGDLPDNQQLSDRYGWLQKEDNIFRFDGNKPFSISTWIGTNANIAIHFDQFGAETGWSGAMSGIAGTRGLVGSTLGGWGLYLWVSDDFNVKSFPPPGPRYARVAFSRGGVGSDWAAMTPAIVPIIGPMVTMLTATYDGTYLRIYVGPKLYGKRQDTSAIPLDAPITLRIGNLDFGTTLQEQIGYWQGNLGEFSMYDRCLTATEIRKLYEFGIEGAVTVTETLGEVADDDRFGQLAPSEVAPGDEGQVLATIGGEAVWGLPARTRSQPLVVHTKTSSAGTVAFRDAVDDIVRLQLDVPVDYKSGDLTVKVLRRANATGSGTAVMRRSAYRLRPGAALVTFQSGVVIDFTPGNTNTQLLSWTIAAADFQAGDGIQIDLFRLGNDGGDTMTDGVGLDGAWLEYTATS